MSGYVLNVDPSLESALVSGHPWIYRNHLPKHNLEGGEWIVVRSGGTQAYGLYDASSPIAVRLFFHEPLGAVTRAPQTEMAHRLVQALELRARFFDAQTNAYRLVFGEGDFLPGLTIDRYERFAVVQTYADALQTILPDVIRTLTREQGKLTFHPQRCKGVLTRDENGLQALWGELPPPELTISENGLRMIANLYDGQKTGLFLDHRDNRSLIERFSRGKRVLNLFSYTGAFSLYAARGGAQSVTSVDIAEAAILDAQRNFQLNGFDPDDHEFIVQDCFSLLEEYARQGRRFDLVIVDPPSLARSKQSRYAAARAYARLNRLALKCVEPGGLLATASCTSQIFPEHFKEILSQAATETSKRVQILQENGQAIDHPVPVSFPEGRYLKFILARVLT